MGGGVGGSADQSGSMAPTEMRVLLSVSSQNRGKKKKRKKETDGSLFKNSTPISRTASLFYEVGPVEETADWPVLGTRLQLSADGSGSESSSQLSPSHLLHDC